MPRLSGRLVVASHNAGKVREIAARGVAVLLVESKLAVAERLATRVFVMSKGEIVFSGSAQELAADASVRRQHLEV